MFITDAADFARAARAWEDAPEPVPDWDCIGQPEPDVEYDQRIAW